MGGYCSEWGYQGTRFDGHPPQHIIYTNYKTINVNQKLKCWWLFFGLCFWFTADTFRELNGYDGPGTMGLNMLVLLLHFTVFRILQHFFSQANMSGFLENAAKRFKLFRRTEKLDIKFCIFLYITMGTSGVLIFVLSPFYILIYMF